MFEKIEKKFGKIYIVIASIATILMFTAVNLIHIFDGNIFNILKTIFIVALEIAILFIINKFIINKIADKKNRIFTIIGLILFLILEIISYIYFKVEYNWDFKWIMESAIEMATTGKIEKIYYFKMCPNNLGALFLVTTAIKLFNNNVIGAYVLNILAIFFAAVFSVLVARKFGGEKLGLNTIIILLGFMPMYLDSPIVYTDTLGILFPIATLYFWILAKEQRKNKKRYYLFLSIIAVLTAVAYYVKANAAIVGIAILIEDLFDFKKLWKPIVSTLLITVVLIKGIGIYNDKFVVKDTRKNDLEIPLTHYLMIGLNTPVSEGGTSIGYGAYSEEDAKYTNEQKTYQDKITANKIRIEQRLKDFGLNGYTKFLFKKFKYVWNDGSYYVLKTIGWDTINTESILYRLVLGDLSENFVKPFMTVHNDTIFVLSLYLVIRKCKCDDNIRVIGTSIVGSAIFLLFWEARSRYIYILIPLFAILAAKSIADLSNNVKKIDSGNIK